MHKKEKYSWRMIVFKKEKYSYVKLIFLKILNYLLPIFGGIGFIGASCFSIVFAPLPKEIMIDIYIIYIIFCLMTIVSFSLWVITLECEKEYNCKYLELKKYCNFIKENDYVSEN